MKIFSVCFLTMFACSAFGQKSLNVFFDFNKDSPNKKSIKVMTDWMKSNPNVEIISIKGYCDSVDDNLYNKDLAKRRINAVLEIIKAKSILLSENLKVETVGEDFKQSQKQEENRKVIFEYIEKANPIAVTDISAEPTDGSMTTLKDLIETERDLLANKIEKAKVGDRIAIYNLHFYFNSENLYPESEPLLEELLSIMKRNPKMSIKIHGHICCNPNPSETRLSFRRAFRIFNYLKKNEIELNRLAYTGVGSSHPLYQLPERNEAERIANRRVEIEIVSK